MRSVVVLIACAGCEALFPLRFSPADASGSDAPDDGVSIDGAACSSAGISDTFDAPDVDPCGLASPNPSTSAGLARENLMLALRPPPGNGSDVSCTTTSFAFERAAIELVQPMKAGTSFSRGTYTQLQIRSGPNAVGIKVYTDFNDGQAYLALYETSAGGTSDLIIVPYNSTMRWLELRSKNGFVEGSYSLDGALDSFQFLSRTVAVAAPAMANAAIDGGTFINVASPGVAFVDNLQLCP